MSESRTFANEPASVRQARRFVSQHLDGLTAERAESVILMVSELVTNSIRHADSQFTVSVDASSRTVRVEVTDGGPGNPIPKTPTSVQTSGRGLQIVAQLAHDWGVRARRGGGKTVWFSVDTR